METEELIEHILRQKHLEEMMNRPEKEHTPLEGMDNEQIKRFALFLFEENQNKSKQLDEMIARLDEIGKDLKEANRKIDSLTDALLKLIEEEAMYAYDFEGRRYDVGDKLGFLQATVEYALRKEELRDGFIEYLNSIIK